MMIPKREIPQAIDEHRTVKAKYVRFIGPVLRGMVLVVVLCALIPLVRGLLSGENWVTAFSVFALASATLMAMIPMSDERTARKRGLPDWSLIGYGVITGLGWNWACAFLWFSRRYSFFSFPVISAVGLIMAFYAVIALIVARSTGGNWRIALLVFAIAPVVVGGTVFRLGLLR